jgi:simple sugar transport system permease protein
MEAPATPVAAETPAAATAPPEAAPPRPPWRWRGKLEALVIPLGVIVVSMILFGIFVAFQGADPLEVFASIKKGSFGSWFSFQNTLIRAAPLMLCSLCTSIPLRLGLVVIGNEGALVLGGLCATIAGLHFQESSPETVQLIMALTGMLVGGLWIAIVGALSSPLAKPRFTGGWSSELYTVSPHGFSSGRPPSVSRFALSARISARPGWWGCRWDA